MGKAGVYVFLIVLGVVVLFAVGCILYAVGGKALDMWREHHRRVLDQNTPWSHYIEVGPGGEYRIGVQRRALNHDEPIVFEGPIEMYTLPPDHDQFDVQVKVSLARDRAQLYNLGKDGPS